MAILTDVPGLRVEVHVNGSACQEYADHQDAPPKTVTKFIEASSGTNFEVKWFFTTPFTSAHGVVVRIILDGQYVEGKITLKKNFYKDEGHTCKGVSKIVRGRKIESGFSFSDLKFIPDSQLPVSDQVKQALADTGQICVEFRLFKYSKRRVGRLQRGGQQAQSGVQDVASKLGVLPEKALQEAALSHYGSFQGESQVRGRRTLRTRKVGNEDVPFARFIFKYRAMASLKDLRIVPRTPSPTPLEDRPAQDLSRDELLELVNRLKERETASSAIKNEFGAHLPVQRPRLVHGEDDDDVVFVKEHKKGEPMLPGDDAEVMDLD